mgnify:CR=1 FL=1
MTEKSKVAVGGKQAQQLRELIARGKEQGYLTYAEVNDHLPNDIVDSEQIEDIVNMINDMGIAVHEKAPDVESITLSDATATDDDGAEEAEAALASVDAEFGRTTDPVRMYMREMGTVELLTREGEIEIAKRVGPAGSGLLEGSLVRRQGLRGSVGRRRSGVTEKVPEVRRRRVVRGGEGRIERRHHGLDHGPRDGGPREKSGGTE